MTTAPDRRAPAGPAIAFVLLVVGAVALTWWLANRHETVDPDEPPIRDAIVTAAESGFLEFCREIPRIKRQAGRSAKRIEAATSELLKREKDGPFVEINIIADRAESHDLSRVHKSLSVGFRQGASRADESYLRDYGNDLADSFAESSRMAASGRTKDELHDLLLNRNHKASDRLIRAIASSRDNRDSEDEPWGLSGYRIDDEDLNELLRTSSPMPLTFGGASMIANAPAEIDPRTWFNTENQGRKGSCQGWGLAGPQELAYLEATGKVGQFSADFNYYNSQRYDNLSGDVGSTLAGGLKSATQDGACPESVMPYSEEYTGKIPQRAFEAAKAFKIRRHTVCRTYDDVFNFIASGQGGVEIGIAFPRAYTKCSGVINSFDAFDIVGGHAMCFLGYSRRTNGAGRKYLWLANSWGKGWGNDGWAEVSPDAIDQMCRHPQTVMIGLSDMAVAKPRDISWIGKDAVFMPQPDPQSDAPLPPSDERADAKPRREMQWTGKGSVF